jgi:hypothetical protein
MGTFKPMIPGLYTSQFRPVKVRNNFFTLDY